MPFYNYRYTREDGTIVNLEKMMKMSERTDTLEVVDEVDGKTYVAEFCISVTAKMDHNWGYARRNADLPPINYRPNDQ